MIALVRGVTALATEAGSNVKVHGSTSTMTRVNRSRWMTSTVEMKVKDGVMTSSPGLRSSAMNAACSASVPLAQGTTWTGCSAVCPSQSARCRGEVADGRTVDVLPRPDDLEHGLIDVGLDAGILSAHVNHVKLRGVLESRAAKIPSDRTPPFSQPTSSPAKTSTKTYNISIEMRIFEVPLSHARRLPACLCAPRSRSSSAS